MTRGFQPLNLGSNPGACTNFSTDETLTTDAAFVWMSLDKSLALMVEGTELSLDDETVLTSSEEEVVAVKQ